MVPKVGLGSVRPFDALRQWRSRCHPGMGFLEETTKCIERFKIAREHLKVHVSILFPDLPSGRMTRFVPRNSQQVEYRVEAEAHVVGKLCGQLRLVCLDPLPEFDEFS